MEISTPKETHPDLGIIDINIETSPSCNVYIDDKVVQIQNSQYAETLQRFSD
jgi:predicted secreted protein